MALLAFATNFPSRFYWTGGSFLRWDWLFYTVAAICCLRKQRPALAGASLAYAAGLRVFPVFLFAGPALAVAWHFYQQRRRRRIGGAGGRHRRRRAPGGAAAASAPDCARTRSYLRFFGAAALAGTLLLAASLAVSGGVSAYREFAANTTKHKETPAGEQPGAAHGRGLAADGGGALHSTTAACSTPGRNGRRRGSSPGSEARPLFVVLALGGLFLLALAARHVDPWVAAALGLTFVPVALELTSYYYAFIIGVALLAERREHTAAVDA